MNGEENLLPGIDLTHNQLFFLNYAQVCIYMSKWVHIIRKYII